MNAIESAHVVFAGTPDFAVPSLRALADIAIVDGVLTQPDRPAGRGRALRAPPVRQFAESRGITVLQPAALGSDTRKALAGWQPDVLVVVAYGLILPQWMLDWPRVAAVNVHASLLPRWRGAAPIQRAILAGDPVTGVSLMRIGAGLDAGPVYATRSTPIGLRETAAELHDRLADLGAALLRESLADILAARLTPVDQDESLVTRAPKISKSEAVLDWRQSAVELARRVRAFNPWPVAETRTGTGERLRIWQAEAVAGSPAGPPGTVVATGPDGIDVATADGLLRLIEVQAPGGRVMSAGAWLQAHDLEGAELVGGR